MIIYYFSLIFFYLVTGWTVEGQERNKFIIYLSDASFHLAGDGKLAGIFQPHPNKVKNDFETLGTIKYQ